VRAFPGDRSHFGVYDMAGNVSEWTSDRSGYYDLPDAGLIPVDPIISCIPGSPCTYRTTKGGGWSGSGPTQAGSPVRPASSGSQQFSSFYFPTVGFRCVHRPT